MAGPCQALSQHRVPERLQQETYVVCETQHDLRRPVPPRRDILSHEPLVRGCPALVVAAAGLVTSRQTKVTDFQLTVGVDEQVTGLQVTVEDICRVNVLQTAKRLVDEGLEVRV